MPATITYTSISLSTVLGKESSGGVWKTITTPITLNDDSKAYRCSLSSTSNTLNVTFTTDTALSQYEIRCTALSEDHGPGIGTLWTYKTNIAKNASTTLSVTLTSSLFASGESTYRISLYAKSQEDSCWDVTELFMVYDQASGSYVAFIPSDDDGFDVQNADYVIQGGHTGGSK